MPGFNDTAFKSISRISIKIRYDLTKGLFIRPLKSSPFAQVKLLNLWRDK